MNLITVGINHTTAPLDVREKIFFSDDEIRTALSELKKKFLKEAVLFSTCNRTELYGLNSDNILNGNDLIDFLAKFKNAGSFVKHSHFYRFFSCGTALHLFRMTTGADSQVIGDIQILGQVKTAFQLARSAGATGTIFQRLFDTAFRVGKRVRTETELCEGAISVSFAAVELANKIFADLSKKSVLLIGTGETGELTAKHLAGRKISNLYVTNRTRSKAEELTTQLGGTILDFETFNANLSNINIIISSIASSEHILTEQVLRKIMKERSNNPLFIIDIGVPRNIDPNARKIENVFLYDIDALNVIVDRNLDKRKQELSKVDAIALEEMIEFYSWFNALEVNPTIQQLREMIESIRVEEVGKNINRFSEADRELVEVVTKRIINKILHVPLQKLKNGNGSSDEEILQRVNTLRYLFGLEKSSYDR